MSKTLSVMPENCKGCRLCEKACLAFHQEMGPMKPRLTVFSEAPKTGVPVICMQCEKAACANVCPVGAISRNEETGAWEVNHIKCIGCKMCVHACPFGAISFDSSSHLIYKCDLCEGEPSCAKKCHFGAITFEEGETTSLNKKKATAERLSQPAK